MMKRSIDDLHKHLNRVNQCCSCHKIFLTHVNNNNYNFLDVSLKCDSYFCERCAKKKRVKLIKRVQKNLSGKNIRFLTLTFDTKQYTPDDTYKLGSEYFHRFIKYLKYHNFKFQYFKVLEFTKSGLAHYHVLLDCYIPVSIIKNIWFQITGSYIVFIKKVRSVKKIISYILIYMTKVSDFVNNQIFYLNRLRRYSYSRFFFLRKQIQKKIIDTSIFYSEYTNITEACANYLINICGIANPFSITILQT